jgi:nucleoside-diphosphate-sugar epimerase
MVVLVTGSSGFLGRSVVKALAIHGASPVAFDVAPPRAELPEGVPYAQGSVANIEEVMAAIVEHRVRRVVALSYVMAPLNARGFHDYIGAVRVNLLGITNVLEAARLLELDRVVFSSSCAVYGPQDRYGERPLTEDDPLGPVSLYGMMKQVNEELARQYTLKHGLQVVIVRPAAILGPGNTMSPEAIVSLPAIGKPGHGAFPSSRHQNAVAVQDLAELFVRLALAPRVKHDCYLASGHSFTWAEVADLVRRYVPDARITFDETVTPKEGGFAYLYDNRRTVTEFNWAMRSLEDSVRMNINAAREVAGLPVI